MILRSPRAAELAVVAATLIAAAIYTIVAPPIGDFSLIDTFRAFFFDRACHRCISFSFDTQFYLGGADALASGAAPFTAFGYIYPSPAAQFLVLLRRITGWGDPEIMQAHTLLACALWPVMAAVAASLARGWGPRVALAAVVLVAGAFRAAIPVGNIDFLIFFTLLLAFAADRRGWWPVSAGLIGVITAIKVAPALVVIGQAVHLVGAWRSGATDAARRAFGFCAVATSVAFALWATDAAHNLSWFAGGADADASDRVRGLGLGTLLMGLGMEAQQTLRVGALLAFGSLAAFLLRRHVSRDTMWAVSCAMMPVLNPLTSSYVYAYLLVPIAVGLAPAWRVDWRAQPPPREAIEVLLRFGSLALILFLADVAYTAEDGVVRLLGAISLPMLFAWVAWAWWRAVPTEGPDA